MKLYVLDSGWEELDKEIFLAGCCISTVSNPKPEHKWIKIPIPAFLIENDGEYYLFDTGCDPDHKKNWPPIIEDQSPYHVTDEQQIMSRLEQLNVTPEMISKVFISHLHADHAGNLFRFTNAEVYINETELMSTLRAYVTGEDMDVHAPTDLEHAMAAKLHWNLIPDDVKEVKIADGLTLLNLGSGHSYGMVAVRIDLEHTGRLLLVADSIYFRENVEPTIKAPSLCYDSFGYRRTARFLLDYAKENNCTIIFGHDWEQWQTLKKAPEQYYD